MLPTVTDQVSLREAVRPEELLRLPEEPARVDALLDDEAFVGPFREFFDPRIGRPFTPVEVYLRLMFLKAQVSAGRRDAMPGGRGLVHLATVLPNPVRRCGAAPDHTDEADHPLRIDGGGRG